MVLKPTVDHQDCCCRPTFLLSFALLLVYKLVFTQKSLFNGKTTKYLTHITQIGINAQIEALVLCFFIGK